MQHMLPWKEKLHLLSDERLIELLLATRRELVMRNHACLQRQKELRYLERLLLLPDTRD
jgi:hypothetical protein